MNKFIQRISTPLLTATLVALPALSVNAKEQVFPAHLEAKLVEVCQSIQTNSRMRLHMAVKRSGLSYAALYKGLKCNGQDVMTFAATSNATTNSDFLARRMTRSQQELLAKR